MNPHRRDVLKYTLAAVAGASLPLAFAQPAPGGIDPRDRVFITTEDSNTLVVIDPRTNTVESTIILTSFDEDPRPPFRYVTAGIAPPHAAMIPKPLYHGAASTPMVRCPRPTAGCWPPAGAARATST